jgi:hypothetical protein
VKKWVKKVLIIVFFVASSYSCDLPLDSPEEQAEQTMTDFLNAITNRNYTLLYNLSTNEFHIYVDKMRMLNNSLVKYKAINIIAVEIRDDIADVLVETKDANGFIMSSCWLLVMKNKNYLVKEIINSNFLSSHDKYFHRLYSQKGIYMPKNDPNMIPYPDKDTLSENETE